MKTEGREPETISMSALPGGPLQAAVALNIQQGVSTERRVAPWFPLWLPSSSLCWFCWQHSPVSQFF